MKKIWKKKTNLQTPTPHTAETTESIVHPTPESSSTPSHTPMQLNTPVINIMNKISVGYNPNNDPGMDKCQSKVQSTEKQPSSNHLSIDLHGMSVKEARAHVRSTFSNLDEHISDLTIITGIGNHINSNGTRGVLYKMLPKFLQEPIFRDRIQGEIKQDMGAYEMTLKGMLQQQQEETSTRTYPQEWSQHQLNEGWTQEQIKMLSRMSDELEKETENGDFQCTAILGSMYCNGLWTRADPYRGIQLLEKAAKMQPDVRLMNQIGTLYACNHMPFKNYNTALTWFTKSAASNNSYALWYLGKMYWLGRGVIKNDRKAIDFLTRSASQPDEDGAASAQSLADIYFAGVDSILQDQALASKYYRISANHGRLDGQLMLAKQLFFGWGIKPDQHDAFTWFMKAATNNTPHGKQEDRSCAQYYVGRFYDEGLGGIKEDVVQAALWYKKAAMGGDIDALFNVGHWKLIPVVYPASDYMEGFQIMVDLAQRDHPNAVYMLGMQYLDGPVNVRNFDKAMKCLEKAVAYEDHPVSSMAAKALVTALFHDPTRHIEAQLWLHYDMARSAAARRASQSSETNGTTNIPSPAVEDKKKKKHKKKKKKK